MECFLVLVAIMAILLSPAAQACLSPYGFLDFEPKPLVAPGGDVEMAPVDVSASTVDDMNPDIISYQGDLYSFWVKETGTTEVTENVMCRVLRNGSWSDLWAVNNIVPEDGSFNASGSRVAGFDVTIHNDMLYIIWSTPYLPFTYEEDNDIVYRTFDGTSWGEVVDIISPGDGAEDVQPTAVSTDDGLLVAWATNNPNLTKGPGMVIVSRLVGDNSIGPVWVLSGTEGGGLDFIPELVSVPGGSYLTWYARELLPVGPHGTNENVISIYGRVFDGDDWSDIQEVSCRGRGESIWVSMLWDGQRLCFAWQVHEFGSFWQSSLIYYREWENGSFTPIQDLTGDLRNAFNGKPCLCKADDEIRIYWHTNDDGFTAGDSFDLVWRSREGDGYWSPFDIFQSDPGKDTQGIQITPHGNVVYASWLTNMTYEAPGPDGMVDVWDVVVGPLHIPDNPLEGVTVTNRWQKSVEAWGPVERIQFLAERSGEPMVHTLLRMEVIDSEGNNETVLEGLTGSDGRIDFEYSFARTGTYTFNISVEGNTLGEIEMVIAPPPPGHLSDLVPAGLIILTVSSLSIAVGYTFVRKNGVVRGKKVTRGLVVPRSRSIIWSWSSHALTYVVKHKWAQGFLQMPLFVLYIATIIIGFFGTQDPTKNFATMVGWTYYLAGILLLYAVFGRLWCYVEACGFVDTWAKNLRKGKSWLEWPEWMKNLWPGFFILLAAFWVEIVFSIDLYPWAVAAFMLTILLINLVISSIFSKRTYCRYVCRDGVIEELIARYSILRIGVRNRPDAVPRGDVCIWTDEERRPGFCSMCFSCVQNDSTVREATVEPATTTFAQDVYRPQAVHKDEATAAIVLMGISIPYMLVLTRLWWVGVAEASAALILPFGPMTVVALGIVSIILFGALAYLAFTRLPHVFTTPRRALIIILAGILLAQYFLIGLGGPVARLVALRSMIVLLCFLVPFIVVWAAEALIVRLTGDARQESAWRLLERYGLVFVPVFLGVLVARNLPLVGTWGWAVWDITVSAFTRFPGGTVEPIPMPFVDPSTHFILGVLSLTLGVAVGSYAALQLSRRLYKEERNAMVAFGVHVSAITFFGGLFVLILLLPPF